MKTPITTRQLRITIADVLFGLFVALCAAAVFKAAPDLTPFFKAPTSVWRTADAVGIFVCMAGALTFASALINSRTQYSKPTQDEVVGAWTMIGLLMGTMIAGLYFQIFGFIYFVVTHYNLA